MQTKAQEAGIDLSSEVAADVPEWVQVDGHRMRQVLTNLISNAIKFTAEGSVKVEVRHLDGQLRIAVVDTGIGMNAETLARIFQPFEQADASTAREYGGTGLGLSICQRLCSLMGGELTASSEPGVGSRFAFSLDAPDVPSPKTPRSQKDVLPNLELKVLVAEDSPVNQLVVRLFLEKLGMDVTLVSDGAEAVAALEATAFDVVLMDLQMPRVDGIEAAKQIRAASHRRRDVPIFALTASVMAEHRRACREAGMNDVLVKPLELEALHHALERVEVAERWPDRST